LWGFFERSVLCEFHWWKFQWAKLDITFRYISPISPNQDLKLTIQRLNEGCDGVTQLLIPCFFPQNSVFVLNFVGFLALRVDVNISQTWIQNSVSSHNCRQTATWSEVTFSGTAPTARSEHTAVWSEAADGMYIFGGYDGSSPVLGAAEVHGEPLNLKTAGAVLRPLERSAFL